MIQIQSLDKIEYKMSWGGKNEGLSGNFARNNLAFPFFSAREKMAFLTSCPPLLPSLPHPEFGSMGGKTICSVVIII